MIHLNVVSLVLLCAVELLAEPVVFIRHKREIDKKDFKICVPDKYLADCTDMVRDYLRSKTSNFPDDNSANEEDRSDTKVSCISARDRYQCLQFVQENYADFVPVEPEDMWVAYSMAEDAGVDEFRIFDEIRTKEEPEGEFRYEAVAVVPKDLEINAMSDLKGLKSCHTGIGRNTGYKIPLAKLKQFGLIGNLNDPQLSPRENELKALSSFFSKACLVGKWSPDLEINKRLKRSYSNLCTLCENPDICDYPDKYSGYDGALRCLAHNGGQIAWTKSYYVKKFFGLPLGPGNPVPTGENPEKFAYLCSDGRKEPISTKTPCRWAARPWQGFMTNRKDLQNIKQLQRAIHGLERIGADLKPSWFDKVLTLNENYTVIDSSVMDPKTYLNKANYTDVIEQDYGPPKKLIRLCVITIDELKKCREFSRMAFSRNVRPEFDCIEQTSVKSCLKTIRDNGADAIVIDAGLVDIAETQYNLKPILAEQYGKFGELYFAVAVVRKDSGIKTFADLKGKRSCHTGFNRPAGYHAPIWTLMKLGYIKKSDCPYAKGLADFFSGGSCLPGALSKENNPDHKNPESLCSICVGNPSSSDSKKYKCADNDNEAFSSHVGAFKCLATGKADVAFVKHISVPLNTDGRNKQKWALNLKSSDFELLCPSGGTASVNDFAKCYLAKIPPHMVVTSNSKTDQEIDEMKHALISAAQLFGTRSDLFNLFGAYNGKINLLFKDAATKLVPLMENSSLKTEFKVMLNDLKVCSHEGVMKYD